MNNLSIFLIIIGNLLLFFLIFFLINRKIKNPFQLELGRNYFKLSILSIVLSNAIMKTTFSSIHPPDVILKAITSFLGLLFLQSVLIFLVGLFYIVFSPSFSSNKDLIGTNSYMSKATAFSKLSFLPLYSIILSVLGLILIGLYNLIYFMFN